MRNRGNRIAAATVDRIKLPMYGNNRTAAEIGLKPWVKAKNSGV